MSLSEAPIQAGPPRSTRQGLSPVHAFLEAVETRLAEHQALADHEACLVAVSGGRDSMVLLHAMARLRDRHPWQLCVAHFHHGLRAAPADADARFVREAAQGLGLRFVLGRGDVRRNRHASESVEQAARRLRHAFLARTARRLHCAWIATGHHADDQLELFLMRLLRGAGAVGLAGMRTVDPSPADPSVRLVRPLLGHEGSAIHTAAVALGVPFREDATNQDPAFVRNRVRHELIPLLRTRFQPALSRVVEREQILLRDQADFLAELAARWVSTNAQAAEPFDHLPVALQREVLRHQLLRAGVPAGFDLIETLRRQPATPVQTDARSQVSRDSAGRLRVTPASRACAKFPSLQRLLPLDTLPPRGRFAFGGLSITWRVHPDPEPTPLPLVTAAARDTLEWFDADAVGPMVRLRFWRPGDRFRPIGLSGTAKLQDLFTNAKVPRTERRQRVVAETAGGTIFWVEGLRIGHAARVTPDTRRRVSWRFRRGGR